MHSGTRRASTASFSSSASRLVKPAWSNTWSKYDSPRRNVGRHSFAIMRTGSLRLICLRFQRSHSGWIADQLTEADGWNVSPSYIIRDRDAVYGDAFIRLRAMGIRDRPTAPRSPWQNLSLIHISEPTR